MNNMLSNAAMDLPGIIGSYKLDGIIAQGSTCLIGKLIHLKTYEVFAGKIVSRRFLIENDLILDFEQEVRALQQCSHPNIINCLEVIYLKDMIVIVMDYCEVGDLHRYLVNQYQTFSLKHIFYQILKAVMYLHQRGIAHKDIKPENILIKKDGTILLGDLGCCQTMENHCIIRHCGTVYYAAPEIFTEEIFDEKKTDIWSIGVILFVMATKYLPWEMGTDIEVIMQIIHGKYTIPEKVPIPMAQIIQRCMQVNPELRPLAIDLLNDPWLDSEREKDKDKMIENEKKPLLKFNTLPTFGRQCIVVKPVIISKFKSTATLKSKRVKFNFGSNNS